MPERSEVPEGWTVTSLNHLGKWSTGGTPSRKRKEFFGGDIPWIKSGDLTDGEVTSTEEKISEEGLNNCSAKILPPGTISIALYGATIGKLGILAIEAATNQACANIQVNQDIVNQKFLFHFLISQRSKFIEAGQGGAQPNLTNRIVRDWLITLPPLAEQHRIVAAIEALFARLDAANARLERVPDILKQFRQSVLAAACDGRLTEDWRAENPNIEGADKILSRNIKNCRQVWENKRLKKLQARGKPTKGGKWRESYRPPVRPMSIPSDKLPRNWIWVSPDEIKNCNDPYALAIGPFGSNLKVSDYQNEGVPLIFVRNIRSRVFKDENTKYVSEEKSSELRPHWVSEGDILITKMGDPPGDASLYPSGSPTGIITADCIKLNLFDEIQDASFFVYAINSDMVRRQIFSITMGVAQKKVSLERFKTIALPLPPLPEQHEIVRRVDALFALADRIEAEVAAARAKTETMRQSILAQAFSGRLVPTEAELARQEGREYEPASVLLERIRSEKKEKKGRKGIQSTLV